MLKSMKSLLIVFVSTFFLSLYNTDALAEPTVKACKEQTSTNTELSQCLDSVIRSLDRELQTWINNELSILEELKKSMGKDTALQLFKRSQSQFESFRETDCKWLYSKLPIGIEATNTYKMCYINNTKNRIAELNISSKMQL